MYEEGIAARDERTGQLYLKGLHDANFKSLSLSASNVLQVRLSRGDDECYLEIVSESKIFVFVSGLLMPAILSAMYLDPPRETLDSLLSDAQKLILSKHVPLFVDSTGSCLIFTANYGDGFLIFTAGRISKLVLKTKLDS